MRGTLLTDRECASSRGKMPLTSYLITTLLFIIVIGGALWAQASKPPAGSVIGNQATATYTDGSGTTRTVTSNLVQTTVQQVAGLTLAPDLSKTVSPGGQVVFPYALTNTGNGSDTYTLSYTELGSSDFNFTSVSFFVDANQDGIPDDNNTLSSTIAIPATGVFNFVLVANVPSSVSATNVNRLQVIASSVFDTVVKDTVNATTTITGNAVIALTKSMSANQGKPGSGPYTVTLTYTNTGNSKATQLAITDPLPAGMSYVSGSGRWSETGTTALTDADNSDVQGTAPNQITYDYNVTAAGQVRAFITNINPGQSGTLKFQVNIANGLAPGILNNTASHLYNDGSGEAGPFNSNTFPFTVRQVSSLTTQADTVSSTTQGGTFYFENIITNTGNGSDVFNITFGSNNFPGGASFILYQSDRSTPLLDSNGDGLPDTGPLAAGSSDTVVVQVILPANAAGGPYDVSKTAVSVNDPSVSETMLDRLVSIKPNTVDLTNNSAGSSAPGAGKGPETAPVVTNTVNPAKVTRFTVHVNNTSSIADNFDLNVSTDKLFAKLKLPTGWSVVFRSASETVISNTGNIPAGGSAVVFVDVKIPSTQTAIPNPGQSLYFRAKSPSTTAADVIHDAVIINTIRSMNLVPNGSGQVFPGGTVIFPHTLINNGNINENDGTITTIQLSLSNSNSSWTALVYKDTNDDGVLDSGDNQIQSAADLGSIAANAQVPLLVKVTAPSGASLGAINTTTLTAAVSGGVNGVTAPAAVRATDNATVIMGNVVLEKTQALDSNCDGTADGSYVTTNVKADPGQCVLYRIKVTNLGTANVSSVIVNDATPGYTKYYTNGSGATTTRGSISSEPTEGRSGTLVVNVGSLAPGESAMINFGVKIDR